MMGEVFRVYPTLWVKPPGIANFPPGGGSVPWIGPRAVTAPRGIDLMPTWLPPPSVAARLPVGGGSVPWTGPRPIDPAVDAALPQTQDLRPTWLPPPSVAALMSLGGGSVPFTGPRPIDPAVGAALPQTQDLRPTYLPPPSIAALTPVGGGKVPAIAPPVTAPRLADFPYWIAGELSESILPLLPAPVVFVPAPAAPNLNAWRPDRFEYYALEFDFSGDVSEGVFDQTAYQTPQALTTAALARPPPPTLLADIGISIATLVPQPTPFTPAAVIPGIIYAPVYQPQIAARVSFATFLPAGGGSVPWRGPKPVEIPRSPDYPFWIAAEIGEYLAAIIPPAIAQQPYAPLVAAPRAADFPYWLAGELAEWLIPTVTDKPFPFAVDRQAAAYRRDPGFTPQPVPGLIPTVEDRAFAFAIDRQFAAHWRAPWFSPLAPAFMPVGRVAIAPMRIRVTFELRDQYLTPVLRGTRITYEWRDGRLVARRRGDA